MSDEVRNGAPYQLIVSFPEQNKAALIYEFNDADDLVTGVGTLVLVHIKENIRSGNGRRTAFEVIAAPDPEPVKKVEVSDDGVVDKSGG